MEFLDSTELYSFTKDLLCRLRYIGSNNNNVSFSSRVNVRYTFLANQRQQKKKKRKIIIRLKFGGRLQTISNSHFKSVRNTWHSSALSGHTQNECIFPLNVNNFWYFSPKHVYD